jgi:hypothetical protein
MTRRSDLVRLTDEKEAVCLRRHDRLFASEGTAAHQMARNAPIGLVRIVGEAILD